MLSSLDPAQWESKCRAVGAARYLQKPVAIEELLREVEFVQESIVALNIGIVDADAEHRARLGRELEAIGCRVEEWSGMPEVIHRYPTGIGDLTLLLVDTQSRDVITALEWAKQYRLPVVVYGPAGTFEEEHMLRLGASLCVEKPVEGERLITQAKFFVA